MATVYIIAAEADLNFLKGNIFPVLPCNGYTHWLASFQLGKNAHGNIIARAMGQCQVIITVVSNNLLQSPSFTNEIDIAFEQKKMNIVIQIEAIHEKNILPERLWALPVIDFSFEKKTSAEELLVHLLPPETRGIETDIPDGAEFIEWNEQIFSNALSVAAARHDHARVQWLISMLSSHLKQRPYPYPENWAIRDMKTLKKEREFGLMISYGNAVFRSGTDKDILRKLFAQALIETKQYETGMKVLNSLINNPGTSRSENFEARGLIGRIYKQLYVNDPDDKGSESLLLSAIYAYRDAYLEDKNNIWHGVNAASCIIRLQRDSSSDYRDLFQLSQVIAIQIVEDLDYLSKKKPLAVWDCASKVEALVALERYREAKEALEVYIHHPDMQAFEVFSTYRQFSEVLQLDRIPEGIELVSRLRDAMERYRAGTLLTSTSNTAPGSKNDESDRKALIIRLSDPSWSPVDIPGFSIESRLGKIITAQGSDESIRKLLEDPMIVAIDESRPAGDISECDKSMPFIHVSKEYTSLRGNFKETGDKALIAIIDDSIDVLHQAFLDANGHCRIVGIWDQTDESGPPPTGFTFGTFHNNTNISAYVKDKAVPFHLRPNGKTHGTHVASIAAGRATDMFAGGVAQGAQLLVIIPNTSRKGYEGSYVAALDFIDKFADAGHKQPVVVNVSNGMNAGAHDGKSSIEVAFDAFTRSGTAPGRIVVKSAGNEANKGTHALVTLSNAGKRELRWRRIQGADPTLRIELWWSSLDEIRFRLGEPVSIVQMPRTAPSPLAWSDWVGSINPESHGTFQNGGAYTLMYKSGDSSNGDNVLVIELGKDIVSPAGLGEWVLAIEGLDIKSNGVIHAWVEKGEGGMPASFQYPHVNAETTLSVPGTAFSVITVAAIDVDMNTYNASSWGPTRDGRNQPHICAPGVMIHAAYAGTGNGVISKNGTSMAAPHVAGAIALLLSRGVQLEKVYSANQISAVLRKKTQVYNSTWNREQGYGVIDVSALLAAFE